MLINCHSHFSLRYGTLEEKKLLKLCDEKGHTMLALTDINNTSACLNFLRLAAEASIHPVIGVDFRNGHNQQYIALARNNTGFHEINSFLTRHNEKEDDFPDRAPDLPNAFVVYPFDRSPDPLSMKDNEYAGVTVNELSKMNWSDYKDHHQKLVFLQTATFSNKREYNIHRILRAIDKNTLLSKLDKVEEASQDHFMPAARDIREWCANHLFLIENTTDLLSRCRVRFDLTCERTSQNQETYTGSQEDDDQLIDQLCAEGLKYRYGPQVTKDISDRLDKELDLIRRMKFTAYFLINWDIVQYAHRQGYFYVGRGSGANSLVAYLLRITDVDPIELDLYFERFINLFRKYPPDFDIDFSWRDREDVTRYIFERFPHTALLATYNTFRFKGAVREVGKVFGLPAEEIDAICSDTFDPKSADRQTRLVLKYAGYLQDRPNHLSIHAGGILISEKPITYFSATHLPPKGFPTVQFDMVVAEDVGLYKFDILGQRGLAKIEEAMAVIEQNHPGIEEIDIHDIAAIKADPQVAAMIREARCLGCFYVESPAMRMLLRKLKVDHYRGLVAASSIIRPGVAQSGMMREYILRHKDPHRVRKYANPTLLSIMPETYGVMVYQEDVIKVAHLFAGLSLGEADTLRRGMSGKYRSRAEFDKVRKTFFDQSAKRGHPLKVVKDVWKQIESFAGYAFSKGHSASYAVESYQSLWLKTHYPLEYMVAVMNNGGGFYRFDIYVHEARKLGAAIEAPCVNHSRSANRLVGQTIYLGLGIIKDLQAATIENILRSRRQKGRFLDVDDFFRRTQISLDQAELLIRVGALRYTEETKAALLWHAHFMLSRHKVAEPQPTLFYQPPEKYELPDLENSNLVDAMDEMELLGFCLCSPFELLMQEPKGTILSSDFPAHLLKRVKVIGFLATVKSIRSSGGKLMYFGTFIDRAGDWIDTIHFPRAAAQYPFRGRGIYLIHGKVTEEFDFYSLEVEKMEKLTYRKVEE